jgi:hypothetical protein
VPLLAEEGPAIVGFVVSGAGTRTVLVRAIGPGLAALGVSGGVPDPAVRLFRGQTVVAENEDWSTPDGSATAAVFAATGAFALPAGSRDASLVAPLAPGAYTVHVFGGIGRVLAEIYAP